MRIAAIDLGSNSFLLTVVQVNGGAYEVLHDEVVITRLGQGVQATKEFHPEALQRVEACFANFQTTIKKFNADKVFAVATSAARDAKNRDDFFALGEKYGIPVEVISGDREAELTYMGGLLDHPDSDGVLVLDIGGGSTEYIAKKQGKISGKSLDIGSVRLTERFVTGHPIVTSELTTVEHYIDENFRENTAELPSTAESIIAVAGTPTTLSMLMNEIEFDRAKVHGHIIKRDTIKEWRDKLAKMPVEDRAKLPGMSAGREDVIVVGLTILFKSLDHFGVSEITVSCSGVRYGLILEQL